MYLRSYSWGRGRGRAVMEDQRANPSFGPRRRLRADTTFASKARSSPRHVSRPTAMSVPAMGSRAPRDAALLRRACAPSGGGATTRKERVGDGGGRERVAYGGRLR
jgi:hypothetical protein